jgi:hypothetical protein
MSPEEFTVKPDATGEADAKEKASPSVEPAEPPESNTVASPNQASANERISSNPLPKPLIQKSTTAAQSDKATTPEAVQKSAAKPAIAAPAQPQPSLPVSMTVRPNSSNEATNFSVIPGELGESFESALRRVKPAHSRNSIAHRIVERINGFFWSGAHSRSESGDLRRMVAFDGFRGDFFEEKRERDRRYGTAYTVAEETNAFLVRLELPRRIPKSSLKQTWDLPDEMPDYACTVSLADSVLTIRAGLPDEARRRVSYVSPSFPSDFQTRIDFPVAVDCYKHRVRDTVLEVIVFKKSRVSGTNDPGRGYSKH